MISETLSRDDKRFIEDIPRLEYCIDDIVYFKVTYSRIHIWYYADGVKFLCSAKKPEHLFNQFIPCKLYLLRDIYE